MTLYREKYRIESARLADWDYAARGWYFVTICTANRLPLFGKVVEGRVQLSKIGIVADAELQTLSKHYKNITINGHIVMPNHVHAIVMMDGEHCFSPLATPHGVGTKTPSPGSLSTIIRSYKAGVTRQCREMGLETLIWQSRFHDHLLRGDKAIAAVREYIRNNHCELGIGQRESTPSWLVPAPAWVRSHG
jgi:hypothetical protein